MRRIAIFQGARLASSRLPLKLLERVGEHRLIDSGLQLLVRVREATGAVPILGVPEEDAPLREAAAAHGIEVVTAPSTGVYATAFGPARASLERRFDWLINGNFLCRPFLSVQTVARIVQHAQVAEKPFLTADAFCGIIWDETGRAVVGAGKTSNTVTNPIAYVANHLADGIPASILGLDEETAAAVPVALPIAEHDRIDIDTLADLHRARQVSLGRLETLAALVAESCPFEVEEIAALDSVPGLVKWLLGRMHRLQRRELER